MSAPDAAEPAQGPGYPVEWEADVVLRDGSVAHVRPIRPDDADALQAFHMAQSQRSTYMRFFAAMERLSERDLRRFTHVDHHDRVALVAVAARTDDAGEAGETGEAGTPREEIIGVTRFDRVSPHEAEVAFNIADAHQGRGLASVLLEHIAAAARERGVERFTAEVLPQNSRMLAVFREAGYELSQRVDDGVVIVGVDLDPTERSRAVMEDRERRAEARSMRKVLDARRVLVLTDPGLDPASVERRLADRVVAGALAHPGDATFEVVGLPGPPDGTRPAHAVFRQSLADAEGTFDLAVLALPAPAVLDAVLPLARRGVAALVVLSGGFAEAGPDGLERQRELVRRAHTAGMRVVGPSSYGLLRTGKGTRLDASLTAHVPRPGTVGLFCQSAPNAVTLLATVARRGLGVSTFVSAGNRADVSGNDMMQFWSDDPATSVVGLYLESIGNPRKFSRVARRLAATKPVVVVAAGRSGHYAPTGHAVRRSRVPRRALEEIMRQSGVIRADNPHQLADVVQLLAHQPLPAGRRVGIVASAPALASLVADAATDAGLTVTATASLAREDATTQEVRAALDVVFAPDACDIVIAVHVPTVRADLAWLARELAERAAAAGRTTLVSALGFHGLTPAFTARVPHGVVRVPAYSTPEDAVWAAAAVAGYARWRGQDHGTHVTYEGCDRDRARDLVEAAPDGELDASRVAELLACYGIEVWGAERVHDADEAARAAARIGYPVALKCTDPVLRHRADLGGVRLGIHAEPELRASVAALRETLVEHRGPDAFAGEVAPFEVQRMAEAGVACVVRTTEDPLYGPLVSFGLAGDAVDLLGDVAYGVPPLTDVDVADMVRRVRAAPRLFGYRDTPRADVSALEDLVGRVSVLADDLPELAALELNPVVVAPHGLAVLGAYATVAHGRRADALRRALLSAPAPGAG